jgi:hypothetical protein
VLKPAGASVAELAATPAIPVPNAANAATRPVQKRTFLRVGMSGSSKKDASRLRACET